MKHSLFKRLVQLLLSLLLIGQLQLFYLSLKNEGIPISKSLLNDYLPESLRLESKQLLYFFPYHFRITEAALSEKASHQIQLKVPYINLSWAPFHRDLGFNHWSVTSEGGTLLSNYYPTELQLSQLKLKLTGNQLELAYAQLRDNDKIFQIHYKDSRKLAIESAAQTLEPTQLDALNFHKSQITPELIQSIHSSKNTAFNCTLNQTTDKRLSIHVSGNSESITYANQSLNDLHLNASFAESEFNIHFRAHQFENKTFDLRFNSIIGHCQQLREASTPTLNLSADSVHYKNYKLDYATARITDNTTPSKSIEAFLFHGNNSLHIKTAYGDPSPKKTVYFKGHINPNGFHTIIPELGPDSLLQLSSETLHATGYVQFNPALEPLEAEANLQAVDFQLGAQTLDYLHTQIQLSEIQLQTHTELRLADRNLSIRSNIDLNDQDYLFLLEGSMYPTEFNDILPTWWQSIFQKFSFIDRSQIQADFSLHGNFNHSIPDQFLGSVIAENIYYRSVYFPYGRLRVQGSNYCTQITLDEVHTDKGQASGQLVTTVKPDGFQEIESLRIDLSGLLSTNNAARLFGKATAQVLDTFKSKHSHAFEFKAAFFNPHYKEHKGKSYYDLFIHTENPFSFYGRPFDSLKAEIYGRNSEHFIRFASAGFAKGTAYFQADITQALTTDPHIRLILNLSECDYQLSKQYLFNQTSPDSVDKANRSIKLNLTLESTGALFDLTRHQGSGSLTLHGEKLSQIYILGPFSKALNELNIPIGTFKLNHLISYFKIQGASIHVPELKINGKQSYVHGDGNIHIPDQTIDFNIKVDLLKNAKLSFTLLGELGRRFNPLTHILDFKVTGTAQEQKWRSRFDPRNLLGL